MKKFLLFIGSLLLVLIVASVSFISSEIKVEQIDKLDQILFHNLKQRGFLGNCFPKNTTNIVIVWDIDTNEFYMKFNINKNEFYNFDQCHIVEKNKIQLPNNKNWIKNILYPNFISKINEELQTNSNLISYISYKDYTLEKNEYLYILIDNKKQVGFAFSN